MKKVLCWLIPLWPLIALPIASAMYFYIDTLDEDYQKWGRIFNLCLILAGLGGLELWRRHLHKSGKLEQLRVWLAPEKLPWEK